MGSNNSVSTIFFGTIRCTPSPQIWEENGGVSCSLNVAYSPGSFGGEAVVEQGFFSYFPPLKPRYILWSGTLYSPKNMVYKCF